MAGHVAEQVAGLQQFLVGAGGRYAPIVEQIDDVAALHRLQSVGDHDDGFRAAEIVDGVHDDLFGETVQRAGGFVEDDHIGIVVDGPGNADALTLATGELYAAFAYPGIQTVWQLGDEF